jgi:hypothetical protein
LQFTHNSEPFFSCFLFVCLVLLLFVYWKGLLGRNDNNNNKGPNNKSRNPQLMTHPHHADRWDAFEQLLFGWLVDGLLFTKCGSRDRTGTFLCSVLLITGTAEMKPNQKSASLFFLRTQPQMAYRYVDSPDKPTGSTPDTNAGKQNELSSTIPTLANHLRNDNESQDLRVR